MLQLPPRFLKAYDMGREYRRRNPSTVVNLAMRSESDGWGFFVSGWEDEDVKQLTQYQEVHMGALEDLKRSASEMTDEELYAEIYGSRSARRSTATDAKEKKKAAAAPKEKGPKQPTAKLDAQIANLSESEKAALLAELMGK